VIVLTYAKVHTCDFDKEAALTPGDGFRVVDLDTAAGPVTVGAIICFDREFPESARILMLLGAEIILVPNACDLEENRIGQLRTRAYENMVGVATANYARAVEGGQAAGPSPVPGGFSDQSGGFNGHSVDFNGHSVAFDGMAFEGIDGASRDTLVVEAGEAEGVYLATFDLVRLREWRAREVWGNAYRRPGLYGMLTSSEVRAPFLRRDALPRAPTETNAQRRERRRRLAS